MNNYYQTGKRLLKILEEHGHKAYFVGGFVRDFVMHKPSTDIDVTTSATPLEVIEIFEHVKETGKKFGSVTVTLDSYKFEVTTFRSERHYLDYRHPSTIVFSKTVEEDLKRRDFTMNGLVMDQSGVVIDLFNGQQDIKNQIIQTIGDPKDRFMEDALRMLRAFYFVSKLGFNIEQSTLNAIKENAWLIQKVAPERIKIELEKLFNQKYKQKALQYMIDTNIHKHLFGIENGITLLQEVDKEYSSLEAFIILYIYGDLTEDWRFSNKEERLMQAIYNLHETTKDDMFNKHLIFTYRLQTCLLANKINVLLGYKNQEQEIKDLEQSLVVKDVCDLKFKGQDILEITPLKNRNLIALVIDDLLEEVIMKNTPNEYQTLKEIALKRIDSLIKEGENNE